MNHNFTLNRFVRWSMYATLVVNALIIFASCTIARQIDPVIRVAIGMGILGLMIGFTAGAAFITLFDRYVRNLPSEESDFSAGCWLSQLSIAAGSNSNLRKLIWLSDEDQILIDFTYLASLDLSSEKIPNYDIAIIRFGLRREPYWSDHLFELPDGRRLQVWRVDPTKMPPMMAANLTGALHYAADQAEFHGEVVTYG